MLYFSFTQFKIFWEQVDLRAFSPRPAPPRGFSPLPRPISPRSADFYPCPAPWKKRPPRTSLQDRPLLCLSRLLHSYVDPSKPGGNRLLPLWSGHSELWHTIHWSVWIHGKCHHVPHMWRDLQHLALRGNLRDRQGQVYVRQCRHSCLCSVHVPLVCCVPWGLETILCRNLSSMGRVWVRSRRWSPKTSLSAPAERCEARGLGGEFCYPREGAISTLLEDEASRSDAVLDNSSPAHMGPEGPSNFIKKLKGSVLAIFFFVVT